jgi:hypothetical protein
MASAGLWRDAGHAGRASGVLWRAQSASNTWPLLSALVLALAEQPNVRISPYGLCKISSLHLGLPSSCKFQGKIGFGYKIWWRQVLSVCTVQPETKHVPTRVKRSWLGFKLFQGVL